MKFLKCAVVAYVVDDVVRLQLSQTWMDLLRCTVVAKHQTMSPIVTTLTTMYEASKNALW